MGLLSSGGRLFNGRRPRGPSGPARACLFLLFAAGCGAELPPDETTLAVQRTMAGARRQAAEIWREGLADLDVRWKTLEERYEAAPPEQRAELSEAYGEVLAKRASFEKRLAELPGEEGAAWEEKRDEIEGLWRELREAVDSFEEDL